MNGAEARSRRTAPPHASQAARGGSEMRCRTSKTRLQRSHWYSYVGNGLTSVEKRSTAPSFLSTLRWRGWLFVGLALMALAACATGKEARVSRLRARATYDRALTELCLDRRSTEPCEPRISAGLASLREAASLDPEEPLYQNTLGLIHLDLRDLPQALEAFQKAIALNPDYGDAHHNLGVTLAESGRWEEAVKAYQRALAILTYTRLESTYTTLGLAYYNLGRLGEAESVLLQAIRLEPTLQAARYHLGLVLEKAGRREEAKAVFRGVRELAPDSVFGRAALEHLRALGEGE